MSIDSPGPPAIECRGLSRSYGRRRVLDGVDLAVRSGEIVGLSGENGSGKSTLLRCLAGYEGRDSGLLILRGRRGYCPQEDCLEPRLTVAEHLALAGAAWVGAGRGREPGPRMKALLERFALAPLLGQRTATISGGARQKLKFLLALAPDPEVLLLDEAYEGFDLRTYGEFWATLAELAREGCAILLVSHLFHEAGRLTRGLEISGGRIADA